MRLVEKWMRGPYTIERMRYKGAPDAFELWLTMDEDRDGIRPTRFVGSFDDLRDAQAFALSAQDGWTRDDYINHVGSERAAIAYENAVLSGDKSRLPSFAQDVLDGRGACSKYWEWLARECGRRNDSVMLR
jgi:hypothetical protein